MCIPPEHFCLPSINVWMFVALKADNNEVLPLHERAGMYTPQGVEMGGGCPPQ